MNTKKSKIIIFSGNAQNKNKENFKYGNELLHIVDKQTYLGIEMTSSGRYTYAREILSKKAYKVLSTIKKSLSNSDATTVTIKNKLFDALVKPLLLYGCEIWRPELLSYKTHFDKSTVKQVHIKFCKQTLNTPWYTENKACRAELGRYPLSIDIKASIFSYWQRLQYKTNNPLLNEAFLYAKSHSQFFDILNSDEVIRKHSTIDTVNQQQIKNVRSSIKKQLRKTYVQNWLQIRSSTTDNSREKFTHKEIKHEYQLENYLRNIRNPAHRISITKLRLGVHSLRIQTGKYENRGASIPVEDRKCLVCKRNYVEDEQHFLLHCNGYVNIRNDLHSLISQTDSHFANLSDYDKMMYLLKLDNDNTCKIIAKYTYLMFQKRKEILNSNVINS